MRPHRSKFYRWFSLVALRKASRITVDSESMRCSLKQQFNQDAIIIQNGVDVEAIFEAPPQNKKKDKLVSIRAITPNYQFDKLLTARNKCSKKEAISFCYPFFDAEYKNKLESLFIESDQDLGRLSREGLYDLFRSALIVFSIPKKYSALIEK